MIKRSISSADNLAQTGTWGGIDLSAIEGMEDEEVGQCPLMCKCPKCGGTGCCSKFAEEWRGDFWLFFGCRHESRDFLYREYLEEARDTDVLQRLSLAFSRDTEEKVYVQHRLAEHGDRICRMLLDHDGYLFVCGDGNKMAKDVRVCLEEAFMRHRGMSDKEARK